MNDEGSAGRRPRGQAIGSAPGAVVGFLPGVDELRFRPATNWIVQSVTKAAGDSGMALVLALDSETPNGAIRRLVAEGRLAGLIVRAVGLERGWVKELVASSAPVVLLGWHDDYPGFHVVDTENLESTSRLVGAMLDRGCERLAMITGPPGVGDAGARQEGFVLAHRQRGMPCGPDQLYTGDYSRRRGYELADRVLGDGCDGVFAANDEMACGVFVRAQELGVDVPGDLMLAGFDGTAELEFRGRSMASVRQPFEELGARAVDTVNWLISGLDVPQQQFIDPEIILGNTLREGPRP